MILIAVFLLACTPEEQCYSLTEDYGYECGEDRIGKCVVSGASFEEAWITKNDEYWILCEDLLCSREVEQGGELHSYCTQ